MASLGTLTIDLIARIAGFVDGMSEAERVAKKRSDGIKKNLKEIGSEIADLGKMGAAGFAAVAGGMSYMTVQAVAAIDAQRDLANQLGTSYESLTNLTLAAKGVGVDVGTVQGAVLKLGDAIGNLSSGAGGAGADALKRLGLSAEELSGMEADEQIATIQQRITDMIPAAEQASVAIDLFGKTAGSAMMQIDSSAIAEASRQAEIFGLNLSDIDAAQVAQIGDAMDTMANATQGFFGQLGQQFAPLIRQLGIDFTDSAEKAGGFGSVTERIFDGLIDAAAFVMNAFDGITRVLSLVVDGIIKLVAEGGVLVDKFALKIVETFDRIPGVDLSESVAAVKRDLSEAEAFAKTAGDRITASLEEPLSGDKFKQYIADAKAASEEAARMAAASIGSAPVGIAEPAGGNRPSAPAENLFANLTVEPYQNVLDEASIAAETFREDQAIADQFAHDRRNAMWADELATQIQNGEDAAANDERLRKQKEDNNKRMYEGAKGFLGNLSVLMNGESKKAFEIGKKAAIAQALISTYESATKAFSSLAGIPLVGPVLGAAAAAAAVAAGMVNVNAIRSQSFGGGGGSPAVPKTVSASAAGTPYSPGGATGGSAETPARNVYFHGIEPGSLYTGQQMLEAINEAMANGGTLRGAYV